MSSIASLRQRLAAVTRRPSIRRTALGLGIFLVLFTLFGYFLLPGIIKSQAETLVEKGLHRRLSIEEVEVSPYALAVRMFGVKLMEPDGVALFAAIDELNVDVSAESLFQLAPVVQEVKLVKPYVHLVRTESHHYNIDDIISLISNQPVSAAPARFSVHNIQVESGRIEFEDRPEKTTHTVSELALGLPFISSLPSQVAIFVEPSLSAKVNGTPLMLKGKARPYGEPRDALLELNFENLDLTRYLEYLPYQPNFKVPSAKLDLHLTASFQQVKGKAPALVLKGMTSLKSVLVSDLKGKPLIKLPELTITLGEANVFSNHYGIAKVVLTKPEISLIRDKFGAINLAMLSPPPAKANGKAQAPPGPGSTQEASSAFNLTVGELDVRGGSIQFDDQQLAHPLSLGVGKLDLTLSKMALDLQKRLLSVGEASSGSTDVLVRMGAIGAVTPPFSATQTKQIPEGKSKDFIFSIGRMSLDGWSARVEDHSLAQSVVTLLGPLSLNAQDMSNAVGHQGTMELKAKVNQGGQLAIAGEIGLFPLHADMTLDLKGVDILSLQPYLTDYVNLLVTRASLSTRGKLELDKTPDGSLKGGFKGDLTIGNLATVDKVNASDFLRWKSLTMAGMDLQLTPFSLVVDQIALSDFFARLIVDADGHINLQDIQRSHPDEQLSLTDAEARKTVKTVAPPPASGTPASIRIRKASLQGGRVRFTDNFIKPHYSATLEDLGGVISDLSSEASTTAGVELRGKVNGAPLNIAGKINPLKGDLFLDLKANVQGMELAPLSSYSGKYVGYGIEKGKLSFEVAYQVDQRQLTAQNRLILDQLTFGEKIDSPTATSLPVQLAVALLRDRNGVIDINLPVGGALDDPQFSLGGIIVKVIVNVITKAVTAPFALLGSLFGGGGEELSWLEFDAGRFAVPPAGETKLQSLTKALQDRPTLKLEIAGRVDPGSDREGLRRASIEHKVKALKMKDLVAKNEAAEVAGVVVKAEEYPALLTRVYRDEKFPKPRNLIGLQKDLSVPEMEKLMAANVQVSDDDLAQLAGRRAQAVKDGLLKSGELGAERLFIVTGKPDPASEEAGKTPPRRADLYLR